MANNRLFLVHRPTGKHFMLGKRLGGGWYSNYSGEMEKKLSEFFNEIEGDEPQDDFCLAIEDGDDAPLCLKNPNEWTYVWEPKAEAYKIVLN